MKRKNNKSQNLGTYAGEFRDLIKGRKLLEAGDVPSPTGLRWLFAMGEPRGLGSKRHITTLIAFRFLFLKRQNCGKQDGEKFRNCCNRKKLNCANGHRTIQLYSYSCGKFSWDVVRDTIQILLCV